jgi:hypothetical protein
MRDTFNQVPAIEILMILLEFLLLFLSELLFESSLITTRSHDSLIAFNYDSSLEDDQFFMTVLKL